MPGTLIDFPSGVVAVAGAFTAVAAACGTAITLYIKLLKALAERDKARIERDKANVEQQKAQAEASHERERAGDASQALRASLARNARVNAERLEDFGRACRDLVAQNAHTLRFDERPEPSFHLPDLSASESTGDDDASLALESRYRDLQRDIEAAYQNINEVASDGYYSDSEEGLHVVDGRAWRAAKIALTLACDYRTHFGTRRADLSPREKTVENEIFHQAGDDE